MITKEKAMAIGREWCAAWNRRDIDSIMEHYVEDVVFYSPTVVNIWGKEDGCLVGREAVKRHFLKGMEVFPDIHFSFKDAMVGVDGMTVAYVRETGQQVMDVIVLNEDDKGMVVKVYVG